MPSVLLALERQVPIRGCNAIEVSRKKALRVRIEITKETLDEMLSKWRQIKCSSSLKKVQLQEGGT